MLLAVDPGKMNGWALFGGLGEILEFGQGDFNSLINYLNGIEKQYGNNPDLVIIEQYRITPNQWSIQANVGSKLETVQAIGVLKAKAFEWEAKVILQEPSAKRMGYMWGKLKEAKSHKDSHQLDALAHGIYYLVKNGVLRVKVE